MKTASSLEAHAGTVESALIFIPDISGFTYFVTETPILHSKDLIAELLQAVIDTNRLGLEISEIEGDAVLFYRLGEPPALNELLAQIADIIEAFERTLREYEGARICCCGACSAAHRLAIKMITHYGSVAVMLVDRFAKLLGPAVIAAHRLLKNPVTEPQYALLTEDYLRSQAERGLSGGGWLAGKAEYEGLGRMAYRFKSFPPEKRSSLATAEPEEPRAGSRELARLTVDTPVDWTHHVLTDLNLASETGEIRNRLEQPREIHRIGSLHTRSSPQGGEIHLETVANFVGEERIWYCEEIAGGSNPLRASFELLPRGSRTELRVSLRGRASEALRNLFSQYARQIKRVSERSYRAADWAAGVF